MVPFPKALSKETPTKIADVEPKGAMNDVRLFRPATLGNPTGSRAFWFLQKSAASAGDCVSNVKYLYLKGSAYVMNPSLSTGKKKDSTYNR